MLPKIVLSKEAKSFGDESALPSGAGHIYLGFSKREALIKDLGVAFVLGCSSTSTYFNSNQVEQVVAFADHLLEAMAKDRED